MNKKLSVVVPVYNEEKILRQFFDRTFAVLHKMNIDYEIIAVNDGSVDSSESVIREYASKYPYNLKGVLLKYNVGQHKAIVAGFSVAEGKYVMTIDADLQNPPEEIPRLFAAIEEGYDGIGTYRKDRDDSFLRLLASKIVNVAVSLFYGGFHIQDFGCMLRIFTKNVTDDICSLHGEPCFIPVEAMAFIRKYREIPSSHSERVAGKSKYSFFSLVRLMIHLFQACLRLKFPVKDTKPIATSYFEIKEMIIGERDESSSACV